MQTNHDSIDQAEILRKRMEENYPEFDEKQNDSSETKTSGLPPRREVHRKKDKKVKLRIRFPLIRLLAISFILIVCIVASYNIWNEHLVLTNTGENEEDANNNSTIDIIEMKETEVDDEFGIEKPDETSLDEKTPNEIQAPTVQVQEEQIINNTEKVESNDAVIQNSNTQNSETSKIEPNQNQTEKIIYHKVRAGETLYRISMKYYKSRAGEAIIKKANGLDSNGTVMTGQVLKIPLK